MRFTKFSVLLLAYVVVGCAPSSQEREAQFEAQFYRVCGDPKNMDSYPLSQECIALYSRSWGLEIPNHHSLDSQIIATRLLPIDFD